MSQAEVVVAGELETQQQVCQTLESELQELDLEIMQCQQSKREVRVCGGGGHWSLRSLGPMLLSSYYLGFLPYHVMVALVPSLPLFRARFNYAHAANIRS